MIYLNCSAQKNLLMENLSGENDIRNEVLKYEQKLNRERLKCRALEEMLLKPTNIHRWRLLKVICVPLFSIRRENITIFRIIFQHINRINAVLMDIDKFLYIRFLLTGIV